MSPWARDGVVLIGSAVALSAALVWAGGWVAVAFGWAMTITWAAVEEMMFKRRMRRSYRNASMCARCGHRTDVGVGPSACVCSAVA